MSNDFLTNKLAALENYIKTIDKELNNLKAQDRTSYDTGSFTPTLVGLTTPGTFTYDTNETIVHWTIHGNRLFFNGFISITATSVNPAGNMTIQGWPYAGVGTIAGVCELKWRSIDMPASFTSISLQFTSSAIPSLIRAGDNVGLAVVQGAELTGGVYDFRFGGSYRIA